MALRIAFASPSCAWILVGAAVPATKTDASVANRTTLLFMYFFMYFLHGFEFVSCGSFSFENAGCRGELF